MTEKKQGNVAKMTETLGRIRPTLNYGDFGNVDIIIEAVVENLDVKRAIFQRLDAVCPARAGVGRRIEGRRAR